MTLAEKLRTKYDLTSFRLHGNSLPLLAINEALEAAAQIADRADALAVASQIRALKWAPIRTVGTDFQGTHDVA